MPSETINSLSPDFRDALLNRNLVPFTDLASASGLGLPTSIQLNFPLASEQMTTIDDNDDAYRDLNTVMNPYKSVEAAQDLIVGTTPFNGGNSNVDFINNQYKSPSLEESPLDDEVESFPYGGTKPISYLTSKNLYSDPTQQYDVANSMYNLLPIQEQIKSYLDEKGSVRGLPPQTTANIIGTLLSGRQLGYSPNGPEPNYDIKSSIVGRVLGPTIGDTPLGLIGGQQLLNAMVANAGSNLQQNTLGRINIEGLFKKNEDFIIPNYEITVRKGFLGKALDFWEKLSGTQWPSSNIIESDASIFTMDAPNISSEQRAQNLLSKYTGRGQVNALFRNLMANVTTIINGVTVRRYTPGYHDNRLIGKDKSVMESMYGSILPDYRDPDSRFISLKYTDSDLRKEDNKDGEFTWRQDKRTIEPSIPTFEDWLQEQYDKNPPQTLLGSEQQDLSMWENLKKAEYNRLFVTQITQGALKSSVKTKNLFNSRPESILFKTQELFNEGKIKSLVSGQYQGAVNDEVQTNTVIIDGTDSVTRGSNVLGEDGLPCRSWTTFKRYNQVENLQKHRGLYQNPSGSEGEYARYRNNVKASVLDDNGFVKITHYKDEPFDPDDPTYGHHIKKYMFSIENLAWMDDAETSLYPCEIGNGDPTAGPGRKRGRIMWFPPYDLSFTDNVSVDITSTNFIGRGEPIYTYNNTERTGTLSFKIIVDHPSYVNDIITDEELDDEEYASIVAGCRDISKLEFTEETEEQKRNRELRENTKPEETHSMPFTPKKYKLYFANNSVEIQDEYENGISTGIQFEQSDGYFAKGKPSFDNNDEGLNVSKTALLTNLNNGKIAKILNENPSTKVYIKGYASKAGTPIGSETIEQTNKRLSEARAKETYKRMLQELNTVVPNFRDRVEIIKGFGQTDVSVDGLGTDDSVTKGERYVLVEIKKDDSKDEALAVKDSSANKSANVDVHKKKRFYTECLYFEKLKQTDEFAYDNIRKYIKFFHPAFHSTTPEGFNSRLTFLHQCTRQGPSKVNGKACNLAFGRPPVCILRIGDFYNTKIMIDSISTSFEPLVWDLNPEGVGVQPMIAHVDITFKYLGGSSLQGPINKLQNAVSFNFFANTEVYDSRADSVNQESMKKYENNGKVFGEAIKDFKNENVEIK